MATWFKHGLLWEPEKKRFGDHAGIGEDDYKMWEGRFFAMFRHPARRAVSEYAHKLRDKSRATARAFAQQHEGMVTLLLTGQIYDDVAGRGPTARMSGPTSDQSALKVLGGYVDPFDTPLYELARARFEEECAAHNVTAESCIRTCFEPLA